jgi:hypothetical protein
MAMASAASSGFGISFNLNNNCSALWTCFFVACQFPQIHCFTCRGVYSTIGIPFLVSSRIITHRACATSIQVFKFFVKNNLSMQHKSILYVFNISIKSVWI